LKPLLMIRLTIPLFATSWAWSTFANERPSLPRGHIFFASDFEGSDAIQGWSGPGVLNQGSQGGHAMLLKSTGGGGAVAVRQLPAERMRGYVVQFSARIKAENVSRKPRPFNGVKFMAAIVTDQEKTWPAADLDVGSYDWRKVVFRTLIPDDARQINLVIGLEAVSGKAWFDDIHVVAWKPPPGEDPPAPVDEIYKGHNLPRLRGAMVGSDIDAEGLRVFGRDWNANLIRWQLVRLESFADPLDLAAYDRWLQSALKKLDAALPLCERYGLYVVVDLHSPPGGGRTGGGYAGSDHGLFTDVKCQQKFIDVWRHIAQRYKQSKAIWGYDLANEPVESVTDEESVNWQELAQHAAEAIRAIDPKRTFIIEPPDWGSPAALRGFRPLTVPNVVYSVHMYLPHDFTHQGVGRPATPYRYPGVIHGKRWDKSALEAALKPAADFQRRYGVHMYIGEFSAIRWAPDGSAARYLQDLLEIFEAHDWDWSYHAFREWDGWSVEHGSDPNDHRRSATPTDRETVLRAWFSKNRKPWPVAD
jgi:endoglucanase